jgi:hypothetical protein
MKNKIKLLLIFNAFLAVLFLTVSFESLYAQEQEVLLNTMDFTNGVAPLKIPSFTITKSYKIISIKTWHNNIFNKPNPTVGIAILDKDGNRICGNQGMPETGFNVPGAVMAALVNCILPPGTYTLWDEDPPTWYGNSNGYYQVKVVGIPQ